MKKKLGTIFLILLFVFNISIMLNSFNLAIYKRDNDLNDINFNIRTSSWDFANATVISDGIQDIIWNDGMSYYPEIAIDNSGNLHVVWADDTDGTWGTDEEIMYASYTTATGWSIATVISDGYMGSYWNDDWSGYPDIAIDSSGNIHVVWIDDTDGIWGSDMEIMYASYTSATGWSNITVISDGYMGDYWNDDSSLQPAITIDNSDKIHVVWIDNTNGIWGWDWEVFYTNYTTATGWSNATVISDGYNNIYWNDAGSNHPAIASDNNGEIHVVWEDETNGIWGSDNEIMHTSYSTSTGWSNATVISDGHNNIYWNNMESSNPDIAIDSSNDLHVVWDDNTDGVWGTDEEIMYTNYESSSGWSVPVVISDGFNDIYWNNGESITASIAIDPNDIIHVAWEDDTVGIWGGGDSIDEEIMYVNYTDVAGWSNVVVISDGANNIYWNDDLSRRPSIIADANNVHAVWHDETNGVWGTDQEIMYTSILIHKAEDKDEISFGFFSIVITSIAILGLIIYIKKKSKL